jgi:hypothetical protein
MVLPLARSAAISADVGEGPLSDVPTPSAKPVAMISCKFRSYDLRIGQGKPKGKRLEISEFTPHTFLRRDL